MDPNFWGPHGWIFLHTITMNYPNNPTNDDKQIYSNFFKSLQYILPCKKCADNYSKNLNDFPIENSLDTKDDLIKWLIDIHNEVNKELGKPILTYDQVLDKYDTGKIVSNKDELMIYKIIIGILICFVFYKCFQKKIDKLFSM